jgi:pimeloyl-ACP methyl ester carboxylesterase
LTQTPERITDLYAVRVLEAAGRPGIRYLDTGEPDWPAVVFFGGLGTSASAFTLTEFARVQRRRLRLRFVSVERNGFASTPFMPGIGFEELVDDVLAVLDSRGIEQFSVVAISGGGPYAARLLERVPERVLSVHLAAATAGGELLRSGGTRGLLESVDAIVADPEGFWDYPTESPVQAIPGFAAACHAEGRRSLGEPVRAAAALRHEIELLGSETLPYLGGLSARVYMYWGAHDELVGMEHARTWQAALGSNVVLRCFEDAGHDVQYLHWPEILDDIARAVPA